MGRIRWTGLVLQQGTEKLKEEIIDWRSERVNLALRFFCRIVFPVAFTSEQNSHGYQAKTEGGLRRNWDR